MKKLFIFLSTIFLAVMTMAAWAQENPKLSYQAVVRDNQNKLLTNSTVNVEINILKPNDAVQYTETFNSVPTNQNGLMSLLIGNKPSWDNVDWIKAKINVKITLPGGMGMVESTSDVSAVPLAISALYADSVNLGAVPQSDWDETNPAKCTFIKNKPNIPDTIKNQLADGNSVINHIVDTIADNHIQWATDTLISNRELRDTMNVARGALADTASVLRGLIDAAGSDITALTQRLVTDSMILANRIQTDSTTLTTKMRADSTILANRIYNDSIALVNRIVSDSAFLHYHIDTTASNIRNEIGSLSDDLVNRLIADSTILANRIHTDSTTLTTKMRADSTILANRIHTDSIALVNRIVSDSIALKGMIDTTSTNVRSALVDTAKNLRDAINDINTNLCTTVMACDGIKTMRDSIQTNKNAIVANATAISDEITNRTAADTEIKGIIKADSTDIMKNVSDTATAIRDLIHGAGGDITALTQRLIADSTILANRIHTDSTTLTTKMRTDSTTLANRIHTDSIALVNRIVTDSAFLHYHIDTTASKIRNEIGSLSDDLVNRLVTDSTILANRIHTDSTTLTTKMRADSTILANRIHTDSIALVNRIVSDSTALKGMIDTTSSQIRSDFNTALSAYGIKTCADVMACDGIVTMQGNISANATKIHNDSTAIMQNVSDTATAIRALITGAHGDVGKLNAKVDSLNKNLFDTLHIKYVTNTVLADTIKDVRDSISALRDSMTTNYVSNADLCTKVMNCPEIQTMRDSIQTNNAAIVANATAISTETTNRTTADNEIKGIINADSIAIMKNVSDTATAVRKLITGAGGDITVLNRKVDSLNTNLFDTLHIKYVTNTVLADTIKDVRDSISALRDSMTTNYVSSTDLCAKVMNCEKIQTMRDSIQTNNAAIVANATAISDEITNRTAADTEIKGIIKADSTDIMKNVSDTATAVRQLIKTASGDVGQLALRVDKFNTHVCDSVKGCVTGWIADSMKVVRDSISDIRTAMNSMNTNVLDSITNVSAHAILRDNALGIRIDTTSSQIRAAMTQNVTNLQSNIDSTSQHVRSALVDTAKNLRDAINDINRNLCTTIMACDDIQTMQTNISTNTTNIETNETAIAANATKIHNDSIAIMKNVSDTATAVRKLIKTASGDVGDLALRFVQDSASKVTRMNTLHDSIQTNLEAILELQKHTTKTALCDSVKGCVTGWIADSMKVVRDSISDIRTAMNSMNTNVLDSITNVSAHAILRDNALGIRIDTTSSQIRAAMTQNVTNLQSNIDSTSQHVRSALVDTAENLRAAINAINTNLCTTVMACEGIQKMLDSIQTNNSAIATNATNIALNATAISTETTNRTNADNEIKEIVKADSTDIMKNVSDTASAIRALITGAHGDVGKLDEKVDSLNNNLFDTLHIKYVTNTVFADTIKDVRDSISALRDSIAKNYVTNDALCDQVMNCGKIQTMRDSIQTNASNIHADSTLFADRIKNLSDSVKNNIKAIADSVQQVRDEIKDTANVLRGLITNVNKDVKSLKDSVEHNYVSNTKLNDTLTHYLGTNALDSIITKSGLADTASNIRSALVDTAGNLRNAINAINTNLCSTVMACDGIKTMQRDINTNKEKIASDSTVFAGRVKNLSDSVKLNITAIADSSKHIRKEIADTANVLRGLITNANKDVKSLKDSVEHNYVSNTKLNDTLTHYLGTNALDSIITKSGLADTASNIRNFVKNNYVSNNDLCSKVAPCVNEQMKNLRDSVKNNAKAIYTDSTVFAGRIKDLSDSVETLYKHTTKAAIRDSVKGQIKDSLDNVRTLIDGVSSSINDATLTIQKNGTTVGTFSANASEAVTANVNVYDGKLYIKFNGDTLGQFSADYKDTLAVNINLKQLSTRLILNENTVDTLDYVEDGLDTTGLVLSIPTGYTQVDTANMLIQFYRNGVYVADTKDGSDIVKFIGGKLYYYPAHNDNKECKVGDRIQVVYWVK